MADRKCPKKATLAGWGAWIRTREWRNQNPQKRIDNISIFAAMLRLCRIKQHAAFAAASLSGDGLRWGKILGANVS